MKHTSCQVSAFCDVTVRRLILDLGPATDLNMRATLIEQHSPPEILVHGLVTPDDVQKLFDLFFKHINVGYVFLFRDFQMFISPSF